jgi:hypothetical protein
MGMACRGTRARGGGLIPAGKRARPGGCTGEIIRGPRRAKGGNEPPTALSYPALATSCPSSVAGKRGNPRALWVSWSGRALARRRHGHDRFRPTPLRPRPGKDPASVARGGGPGVARTARAARAPARGWRGAVGAGAAARVRRQRFRRAHLRAASGDAPGADRKPRPVPRLRCRRAHATAGARAGKRGRRGCAQAAATVVASPRDGAHRLARPRGQRQPRRNDGDAVGAGRRLRARSARQAARLGRGEKRRAAGRIERQAATARGARAGQARRTRAQFFLRYRPHLRLPGRRRNGGCGRAQQS